MKITDALIMEHAVFRSVFRQIERQLPQIRSSAEINVLARLVEGLLEAHGHAEEDMLYAALDHALAERSQLQQLHRDHRELDERYQAISRATNLIEARSLLEGALQATRNHFDEEERHVFPLTETIFGTQALSRLGDAWVRQCAVGA